MKKKIIVLPILLLTFSSCASLTNHIKEFGEARITADYFLKDYSDFFYYVDKDYVCVAQCSSKVIKGDYVSAINGKKGNSYRFYTFANYDEKEYLLVNKYNKLKKIDEDYFYASIDAPSIPFEFLFFPYKIQDPEYIVVDSKMYILYDESVQLIEKGEEVVAKNGKTYNFVKDHQDWIMEKAEKTTKLFYSTDMSTFDVHMAWVAKDITVK